MHLLNAYASIFSICPVDFPHFRFTISGFGWGVCEKIKIALPKAIPSVVTHKLFQRAIISESPKIEWHAGELFPRVGFIVTNLRWKSSNVVRFYNKRGTAEQWIKEGKYALKWTRLSCHDFVDNQVRLQLFALAYNLGHFPEAFGTAQVGEEVVLANAA